MSFSIELVLSYLNHERIRATYGAVGAVVGFNPRNPGPPLAPKRPAASWVVAAKNGQPTGFRPADKHPDLVVRKEVIRDADDLRGRIAAWRSRK
jgi:hypothetical protein